ncbi:MAG: helix-hairpin-helix domain-containing protein [Chloroflexi bacterium]|nr:helix-hairpin-helix domain-containing protein [Chloroflexota bacterium]MCI0648407.1 helix-hairpin-helix domain-containing protein [Chloroflexota bacterium]MCI0727643.1 helix-hairpin-helix domain-containing protein [Chloroflexota bacterium]
MTIDKTRLGWYSLGILTGVIVAVALFVLDGQARPAPIHIESPQPTATSLPTATPGPLRVYISGEVAAPAVYQLPAGSIIQDAVNAAGGFTTRADPVAVNLAQPLADGMHVHVPSEGQAASVPVVSDPAASVQPAGGLVNINTATLEELDTLPGVGPSTAENIIEYRQANGPFATPDDIMDVPGIGEGKFEDIKDLITVE